MPVGARKAEFAPVSSIMLNAPLPAYVVTIPPLMAALAKDGVIVSVTVAVGVMDAVDVRVEVNDGVTDMDGDMLMVRVIVFEKEVDIVQEKEVVKDGVLELEIERDMENDGVTLTLALMLGTRVDVALGGNTSLEFTRNAPLIGDLESSIATTIRHVAFAMSSRLHAPSNMPNSSWILNTVTRPTRRVVSSRGVGSFPNRILMDGLPIPTRMLNPTLQGYVQPPGTYTKKVKRRSSGE
jgi:hypothetical protein